VIQQKALTNYREASVARDASTRDFKACCEFWEKSQSVSLQQCIDTIQWKKQTNWKPYKPHTASKTRAKVLGRSTMIMQPSDSGASGLGSGSSSSGANVSAKITLRSQEAQERGASVVLKESAPGDGSRRSRVSADCHSEGLWRVTARRAIEQSRSSMRRARRESITFAG